MTEKLECCWCRGVRSLTEWVKETNKQYRLHDEDRMVILTDGWHTFYCPSCGSLTEVLLDDGLEVVRCGPLGTAS
jgi:hypothetical protein